MEQKLCYGCMKQKTQSPICEHCGFDENKQNEVHQLPLGTVLQNQYIVGRVLGQGGFGITYIGWDRNLAIPVAIKEYFPSGIVLRQSTVNLGVTCYTNASTDSFISHRDRFLREARTLAQLSGVPEIVQVRNFFTSNNTAYIVMEYVQGITLKGKLKQLGRRMTVQEVLDIMRPVMKALSKVHNKSLIHRDISPDNIMLTNDGGVKLIDFGTVRNMDNGMMTKATEAIMKPGFAPIEQYQTRGNLGTWTDVYALSATMHYCMTGKIPEDALERLENGGALTHLQNVPGLTPKMRSVMEKGLAVRIADRYATLDEMYQDLYQEPIGKPSMVMPEIPHWQNRIPQQPEETSQLRPPSRRMPPDPIASSAVRPDLVSASRIRPEPITPSGSRPEPIGPSGAKQGSIFTSFSRSVPAHIIQYCESVAQKPILVETYLQQCVNVDKISEDTAKRMLEHYKKNKPAPAPAAVSAYEPNPHAQIVDDGTIFGRFQGHVPASVLEHCESVSHKPILVETYLQQCVNMGRVTPERAKEMIAHYKSVPHPEPVPAPQVQALPPQRHTDGSIFGMFRTDVPSAIVDYCEGVADKSVLVETYLRQCVNTNRIPQATAQKMLDHYKSVMASTPDRGGSDSQQQVSLYCTECGMPIPENSRFCCHCGSQQKPVSDGYPRWYCSHCNSQIPHDSKYCRSCGNKVDTPVIHNYPEGHCQNCGTKLMPDSKFCFNCGTPVVQAQASKPPQGFCHNCGQKLSENARFCVNCGTPVK